MYAKIQDGQIVQYPFTQADLQAQYPNASLPAVWLPAFMQEQGIVHVVVTGSPAIDHTQNAVEGLPVFSSERNRWEQTWQVNDATVEEIAQRTDAKAAQIRSDRSQSLKECDWTQLDDTPISNSKKLEWATYRQALRDITAQPGFPWNVVWPDQP